ncbi:MAG: protein-L-isoaspartate(D-aspartate) O-methyltransferase [Nitrospinota bacterium]|nr:protein-L-isoaspartate(D-aspartate) O-methyltransferase [Nitrospinota bacterium]
MNVIQTLTAIFLLVSSPLAIAAEDRFDIPRKKMLAEIVADMKYTAPVAGKTRLSEHTIKSMAETKRHLFVSRELLPYAYRNRPLPIGYGQTISQPYIVALMTELLDPDPEHRVLEIGTGSGYQAAVLAPLVKEIYTIEIVPQLHKKAKERLSKLGYTNIECRLGDGYFGWEDEAPFDSIIVTAAADHVPPSLVRQLKPGGRMIIPVGAQFVTQQLTLVTKDASGKVGARQILPVRFVPFTRGR